MVRCSVTICALTAVASSLLGAARSAAIGACQVADIPEIEISDGSYIEARFREIEPRYFEILTTQRQVFDKDDKVAEYRREVAGKLPDSKCGRSVSLRSTSQAVSHGDWVLKSGIRSKAYLCLKTNGFCCSGLKCKKCTWVVREEDAGFRKTLDLTSRFVPRVDRKSDQETVVVDVKSDLEDLEDWEKSLLRALRDVAGALDLATLKVLHLRDQINFSLPPTPGFELLRERYPSVPNYRPKVTDTRFENSSRGLALATSARDERTCAVAEQIYEFLRNQENFRAQHESSEAEYSVEPGDSLWKIAEVKYGDGRYFLPLAQFNNIHPERPLQAGGSIRVPTIRRMEEASDHMVSRDESLWSISGPESLEFARRVKALQNQGRDPNLVYPAEILR